jgi:hypothetical protein
VNGAGNADALHKNVATDLRIHWTTEVASGKL